MCVSFYEWIAFSQNEISVVFGSHVVQYNPKGVHSFNFGIDLMYEKFRIIAKKINLKNDRIAEAPKRVIRQKKKL